MTYTNLQTFEQWMSILLYIANTDRKIRIVDIMEDVLDMSRGGVASCMRGMVEGGYLIKTNTCEYLPTQKTLDLFKGVKL